MSSKVPLRIEPPSFSQLSPSSPVRELGPINRSRPGKLVGGWGQLKIAGLRAREKAWKWLFKMALLWECRR